MSATISRPRLDRALNIADLRRLAHRRVPGFALAYLESGAEDEATLAWNREVFKRWRFVPDTLIDAAQRSLATRILGTPSRAPFIVAPTGFNGMLHHQADILLAQAARDAGIPFTLSTMASASLEDIAQHAPGGRFWFQLYMLQDRDITRDLLRRAAAAGCEALVFTTDCVHFGNRESERRFFRAPLKLSLRSMLDTACHPGWVFDVIGRGRGVPGFGNLGRYFSGQDSSGRGAMFIASKLDFGIDWRDLDFVRQHWQGKLIVKGILHAADAQKALALGADALVLTNHGGRQLDGAISPLEALPDVRAACPDAELIIDSGFRRGTDVAKALALGADSVMLGRALLYGVAAAGRPGIDKALAILGSELERTLGQLGVTSVGALESRHLQRSA